MSIPLSCPDIDLIKTVLDKIYDNCIFTKDQENCELVSYALEALERVRDINKQLRTDTGDLLYELDNANDRIKELENDNESMANQITDLTIE